MRSPQADEDFATAASMMAEVMELSVYDDPVILQNVMHWVSLALGIQPDHTKALRLLAELDMALGDYDDAAAVLRRLTELAPQDGEHAKALALVDGSSGEVSVDEVRAYFRAKWKRDYRT